MRSLTVSVAPPDATADGVASIGSGVQAQVYKLNTANENSAASENPEFHAEIDAEGNFVGECSMTSLAVSLAYSSGLSNYLRVVGTHCLATDGGPKPAHLLPKIHNSPACLSGRRNGGNGGTIV